MNDQEASTQIEALEAALAEQQRLRAQLESDLVSAGQRAQALSAELETIRNDIWSVEEVQQALEAVNRSGSEFVIHMDHQVRTSLNGLLGMLELLLSGELGTEERDFAASAHASGQELMGILNDVADYCRLDAGQVELVQEPFEARQLLEDGVAMARAALGDKPVEVRFHTDERLPTELLGDEPHLRRVLQHLVENAVTFTTEGSIDLAFELSGQGEDAAVQLVVADEGCGMSSGDLQRVLEPFVSLGTDRLGLGLTMVRRLVEAMQGSLRLESERDRGTRAIVTFPLARVVAGGQLPEPTSDQPTEVACEQARILVVEDNAVNQKVATGFLKMIGCEAVTASNGQEALDLLATDEPFDLILMDCMMPVLDGYGATTAVRSGEAGEARTSIPILALTADESPGARQACLKAGMDDYLTKPIRIDRLRSLLRIWLPPALRPSAE